MCKALHAYTYNINKMTKERLKNSKNLSKYIIFHIIIPLYALSLHFEAIYYTQAYLMRMITVNPSSLTFVHLIRPTGSR